MAFASIDDVEQWNLLLVVSPLFAADIAWTPFLETDPHSVALLAESDRESLRIVLRESADCFRAYIKEIPIHVPFNYIFSNDTHKEFVSQIDLLLKELEGLVGDAVCHQYQARRSASWIDLGQQFPKLVALGRLMSGGVQAKIPDSYTRFLILEQRPLNFIKVRERAKQFNNKTSKLLRDPGSAPVEPFAGPCAMSNPQNQFDISIWDRSNHLFQCLAENMEQCTPKLEHRAMLHLKHFFAPEEEDNGNDIEVSMLLESCLNKERRQQTQCVIPLKRDDRMLDGPDPRIHKICEHIQQHKASHIFAIQLCGDTFLNVSTSVFHQEPKHPTAATMISLSYLRECGMLEEKYRFSINDKKILAYTLSRALLIFYPGPWLQNLWTFENILFPYDSKEDTVYNIHQPYVSCILSQEPPLPERLDSMHEDPLILSFAKLLVELESGEEVQPVVTAEGRDFFTPLRELSKHWSKDHLDPRYEEALYACVNFPKFRRRHATIHDTILNHIVHPLEETVEMSRASDWGRKDMDLTSGSTTSGRQSTLNVTEKELVRPTCITKRSKTTPSGDSKAKHIFQSRIPQSFWRSQRAPTAIGKLRGKASTPFSSISEMEDGPKKLQEFASEATYRPSSSYMSTPTALVRKRPTSSSEGSISKQQNTIQLAQGRSGFRYKGSTTTMPTCSAVKTSQTKLGPAQTSPVASKIATTPTLKKPMGASNIPRPSLSLIPPRKVFQCRLAMVCFDTKPSALSSDAIPEWKKWLKDFKEFRTNIVSDRINENDQQRVRVTVIDTGVHVLHPLIKKRWRSNQDNGNPLFCDFVVEENSPRRHRPIDEDGHGTFIAGILLQTAPEIELCVARIGVTQKSMTQDAEIDKKIGNAISHAIEVWETDIISMSFGRELMSEEMRKAVEKARSKNVILLAAAGNAGNHRNIPYPAKEEGVFKIFAAHKHGFKADFSPVPAEEDLLDSFSILGCNVVSAWPLGLREKATSENLETFCYKKGCEHLDDECDLRAVMSGTSYATPVAAALVALIYQFYDENGSKLVIRDTSRDRLKTHKAVRAVLRKMSRKGDMIPFLVPSRGDNDDLLFQPNASGKNLKNQDSIDFFADRLSDFLDRAGV